jgi:hypothetical protein
MKALWLQLDELIKATIHLRFLEPSDNCAALAVSPNANVPTLGLVAIQAVLPGDLYSLPIAPEMTCLLLIKHKQTVKYRPSS